MSLVNAFGALNLEATQAAVLAELQQKLEPGQSIVVSSVGGTVTVSGTVALDAPTLAALEAIDVRQAGAWTVTVTDGGGSLTVDGTVELGAVTLAALETINAIVSGSVAIANFPATQPVSGTVAVSNFPAFTEIANDVGNPVPVSGTMSINQPVAVTDNAGSLTTDGTYDERWSGGKLAASALLNTAGDNTLVTPGAGQSVRLVWISIIPNTDNSAANLITVKFGAGGTPMYLCYAAAHWENFLGGVNVPLVVNLQNAQQVAVTAHYRLV